MTPSSRNSVYSCLVTLLACSPCLATVQDPEPLLGGCVQRRPVAPVPEDLHMVTRPSETDRCPPFTQQLSSCGITLVAGRDVEGSFLVHVGEVIAEIFARVEKADRAHQDRVLGSLHAYGAMLPVPKTERAFERLIRRNEEAFDALRNQYSICDIIISDVPQGRVMEVVEHVLHTITDVGLHYAYPEEWGLTRESALYRAMETAIRKGCYDVSSYKEMQGDVSQEEYDRVLLQEFAYWFVSTAWDLQRDYGPHEREWTLRTPAQLRETLPEFYSVYESTAAKVLNAPSRLALKKIGPANSQPSQGPKTSNDDEARQAWREYWDEESQHRGAGDVDLPDIDTSASADGIVDLPPGTPALFLRFFSRYTKVVAPNGKPIHLLAHESWTRGQILHARKVLEHILTDVPGSLLGSDKSAVANAMADRRATMVLMKDHRSMERAFRTGLDRANLFMQDLRANECPADGSADYLAHHTRDAAFEEILHLVHDAGIRPALPEYDWALHQANLACSRVGHWQAWPPDEPLNHGNEYFACIFDNYLDLWTRWPSHYEGDSIADEAVRHRGASHFGMYKHGSRAALKENDPGGFALLEQFFGPYLTYTFDLPPEFDGIFTLQLDTEIPYSTKSQHLKDVRLRGVNNSGLIGNHLDNRLTGNAGDNSIDGAGGRDTVVFQGPRSQYIIERGKGQVAVRDTQPARDGTDTLASIEVLEFSDELVILTEPEDPHSGGR